jgi:hypothetical protein
LGREILVTRRRSSPEQATTYGDLQDFYMGGAGLEPAAPSLSIRGSRSRQFAWVRSNSTVEPKSPLDRTLREPERTLILAILATRDAADELVIAAVGTSEAGLDIGIADTLPSRPDRSGSGVSTLAQPSADTLGGWRRT